MFYFLGCFISKRANYVLQFSRRDDLRDTGLDPTIEIVASFGPVFLTLREARRTEAFHTITDFTLLHVLSRNWK